MPFDPVRYHQPSGGPNDGRGPSKREWLLLIASWVIGVPIILALTVKLQDLIAIIAARWN